MKYLEEWKQCRHEAHSFNRMLIGMRLGVAAIFSAFVFFSIYLVLYSPIMLIFSVMFVSVMWLMDKRHSMYLRVVAERSFHLEKLMNEDLSATAVKNAHDHLMKFEKAAVPAFYTLMIGLGVLLSWVTISTRVASYLPYFYMGFAVYGLLYVYWILNVWKMD